MFCQFCGTPIAVGGSACPKCGAPATGGLASAAAPQNAFAPPPGGNWTASPIPPRQGSSTPWILIAAVGCLGIVFVGAIAAAILLPAFAAARKATRTVDCRNDMKQIGVYVLLYESKYRDYPEALRDIYRPDLATDPNIFICPVNGQPFKSPSSTSMKWDDFSSRVGIEYLKPPSFDPMNDRVRDISKVLMAWERTPHSDGRRTVLFVTGRVDTVDDAMFQAILKARREWK
ncbi:MAG: DUF1559 domain-containing protein [Planctomycetota bacterium]